MIVEVEPGSGKEPIESGANFTLAQTEPNTNLDAFLATLDGDTRQYLQLLVAGGAQGLGGRGRQTSNALRRFQPFVHYTAKLNKAVAQRHVALANVIHNFSQLTTELGRHDAEIKRFVTSSDAALGNFANQQQAIQDSLKEFPAALRAGNAGLASSKRFSDAAYPALTGLIPQAQASVPAFKATERMFSQTTAPIRDQIRPFTRQIRPVLTHANEGSASFKKTVQGFGDSLGSFNTFFNELAYKPSDSRQSFLFYLPWLNHNYNASFNLQDAGGPIQRGLVLLTCNASNLATGFGLTREYFQTLLEVANVPKPRELPDIKEPAGKFNPAKCGSYVDQK
jgi:phospholipid/cholesterol/gamma-HCH transport system substrate-binding protein